MRKWNAVWIGEGAPTDPQPQMFESTKAASEWFKCDPRTLVNYWLEKKPFGALQRPGWMVQEAGGRSRPSATARSATPREGAAVQVEGAAPPPPPGSPSPSPSPPPLPVRDIIIPKPSGPPRYSLYDNDHNKGRSREELLQLLTKKGYHIERHAGAAAVVAAEKQAAADAVMIAAGGMVVRERAAAAAGGGKAKRAAVAFKPIQTSKEQHSCPVGNNPASHPPSPLSVLSIRHPASLC